MTSRKLDLKVPTWARWVIYICIAIATIGTALTMLANGYAKAEPHLPASRQEVRDQRSWAEDEHAGLRGDAERERQVQDAILCTVNEARAEALDLECDL